jgi:hypothetical protein
LAFKSEISLLESLFFVQEIQSEDQICGNLLLGKTEIKIGQQKQEIFFVPRFNRFQHFNEDGANDRKQ